MMRMAGEMAIAISGSLALSLVVKATVVSAGALAAAFLARRSRASVRHLLLATSFILLLTLPLASVVVPAREVSVPIAQTAPALLQAPATTLDPIVPLSPPAVSRPASARPARIPRPSLSQVLLAAWLAGVTVVFVPMIVGLVRIRRLRRNGLPWRAGQAVVADVAARLGVRASIQVLLDEAVAGPMTCGVVRPAIVLPRDARAWDQEDFRRAIVHELEHIRRGDWFVLYVARVVCAIYWFHPLVWMAWRQLRLEAEKACDDAVLDDAVPEAYADQLVTLAERAIDATQSALAMANRGDLFARIAAVLDERQARGRAGARWIVTVALSGGLLLIAVAPLRAVVTPRAFQQPAATIERHLPEATTPATPRIEAESPRAVVTPPAPVANQAARGAAAAPSPAPPAAPVETRLPRFEVVSVKVNNSGDAFPGLPRLTPGRATLTNVGIRQLIQLSYGIRSYQLVGLPDWAESARFDVTAASDPNATPAELLLMVRGLLADRFQFSTRKEVRQLETYSLVETAPGSAKLRKSEANCAAAANAPLAEGLAAAAGGRNGPPRCQILPMTGRGRLIATGVALSDVINVLTGVVGRMVVDKTGLNGPFDVNLSWTPDPALQAVIRQNDPLSVPDAPSIFTAVEEQLGLRLVPDRAPVDVMVVERLDRPTPD